MLPRASQLSKSFGCPRMYIIPLWEEVPPRFLPLGQLHDPPVTKQAKFSLVVLYCQSMSLPIKIRKGETERVPERAIERVQNSPKNIPTILGMLVPGGSSGPASRSKTFHSGISLNLEATTEPADPPKSKRKY